MLAFLNIDAWDAQSSVAASESQAVHIGGADEMVGHRVSYQPAPPP